MSKIDLKSDPIAASLDHQDSSIRKKGLLAVLTERRVDLMEKVRSFALKEKDESLSVLAVQVFMALEAAPPISEIDRELDRILSRSDGLPKITQKGWNYLASSGKKSLVIKALSLMETYPPGDSFHFIESCLKHVDPEIRAKACLPAVFTFDPFLFCYVLALACESDENISARAFEAVEQLPKHDLGFIIERAVRANDQWIIKSLAPFLPVMACEEIEDLLNRLINQKISLGFTQKAKEAVAKIQKIRESRVPPPPQKPPEPPPPPPPPPQPKVDFATLSPNLDLPAPDKFFEELKKAQIVVSPAFPAPSKASAPIHPGLPNEKKPVFAGNEQPTPIPVPPKLEVPPKEQPKPQIPFPTAAPAFQVPPAMANPPTIGQPVMPVPSFNTSTAPLGAEPAKLPSLEALQQIAISIPEAKKVEIQKPLQTAQASQPPIVPGATAATPAPTAVPATAPVQAAPVTSQPVAAQVSPSPPAQVVPSPAAPTASVPATKSAVAEAPQKPPSPAIPPASAPVQTLPPVQASPPTATVSAQVRAEPQTGGGNAAKLQPVPEKLTPQKTEPPKVVSGGPPQAKAEPPKPEPAKPPAPPQPVSSEVSQKNEKPDSKGSAAITIPKSSISESIITRYPLFISSRFSLFFQPAPATEHLKTLKELLSSMVAFLNFTFLQTYLFYATRVQKVDQMVMECLKASLLGETPLRFLHNFAMALKGVKSADNFYTFPLARAMTESQSESNPLMLLKEIYEFAFNQAEDLDENIPQAVNGLSEALVALKGIMQNRIALKTQPGAREPYIDLTGPTAGPLNAADRPSLDLPPAEMVLISKDRSEALGLFPFFAFSGKEMIYAKPSPENFKMLLERLELK